MDIVERLRSEKPWDRTPLVLEAADEIERLLAQNLRFATAMEIGDEAFPGEAWDAVLNEATAVYQQLGPEKS